MSVASQKAAAIVFCALENERCLDLRYKVTHSPAGQFLNYKVMKQAAIRQRFGKFLTPALVIFSFMIPALLFSELLRALFFSLRGFSPNNPEKTIWLVPSLHTNEALIHGAVAEDFCNFDIRVLDDFIRQLAVRLGPRQIFYAAGALVIVVKNVSLAKNRRVEMILHSRDALALILLALYARRREDDIFVTDSHYQRWAFVLSHSAMNFYLVQHGELDDGIVFPHSFGIIQRAYIRSEATLRILRCYYSVVDEERLYYPVINLTNNAYADTGVFIASSAPSLQEEIDFVIALRALRRTPIIVKLHPAHYYDKRKKILLAAADHICASTEIPDCCIFVSYSSSMEQLYQLQGISTVSIAKAGSALKAVQLTLRILDGQ